MRFRIPLVPTNGNAGVGFRNAIFNIEFIYQPENYLKCIVEINPRMASQFADLYEKVDGFNSYSELLDLAAGRKPHLTRPAGPHAVAASCVLRTFQDMQMVQVPSSRDVENPDLELPGYPGDPGYRWT